MNALISGRSIYWHFLIIDNDSWVTGLDPIPVSLARGRGKHHGQMACKIKKYDSQCSQTCQITEGIVVYRVLNIT